MEYVIYTTVIVVFCVFSQCPAEHRTFVSLKLLNASVIILVQALCSQEAAFVFICMGG